MSSRLAIGIATRGRPNILRASLCQLQTQQRPPDAVFVAYSDAADIGDSATLFSEVTFLHSKPGLTSQRNTIITELSDYDFITFIDDDFWLAPDYLSVVEQTLLGSPGVVVLTGTVLADGINGPGLNLDEGLFHLQSAKMHTGSSTSQSVYNAYGCNMTIRLAPVHSNALRFDEQLPLYGWYEDVDFSRQMSRYGTVIRVDQAYGVHLGVKSGRQSGLRLGYSQVANPVYLARKGSVHWPFAIASMTSRSLKNLWMSSRPEPLIDRRGRLRGNARAWLDLVVGRLHPTRILEF